LIVTDASGVELNRVGYTVAGDADIARSLDKNAELADWLDSATIRGTDQVEHRTDAGAGLIMAERDQSMHRAVEDKTLPRDHNVIGGWRNVITWHLLRTLFE
jgi:hypothetical protein